MYWSKVKYLNDTVGPIWYRMLKEWKEFTLLSIWIQKLDVDVSSIRTSKLGIIVLPAMYVCVCLVLKKTVVGTNSTTKRIGGNKSPIWDFFNVPYMTQCLKLVLV